MWHDAEDMSKSSMTRPPSTLPSIDRPSAQRRRFAVDVDCSSPTTHQHGGGACFACNEMSTMYQKMRQARDEKCQLASDLEEKWRMAELSAKVANKEASRQEQRALDVQRSYDEQCAENARLKAELTVVYRERAAPLSVSHNTSSPPSIGPPSTPPTQYDVVYHPHDKAPPLYLPQHAQQQHTTYDWSIDAPPQMFSGPSHGSYAEIASRRRVEEESAWLYDDAQPLSATPPYTPLSTNSDVTPPRLAAGGIRHATLEATSSPITPNGRRSAFQPVRISIKHQFLNQFQSTLPVVVSFESMRLNPSLQYAVSNYGLMKPSTLQARTIPAIMEKRNLVILTPMQCNTDKAIAIAIASINCINAKLRRTQCIIVTPTRETATMLASIITTLSASLNLTVFRAIGGRGIWHDVSELRDGAHIIIATPARIDHLFTDRVRCMIVDDADELFSRGSKQKLYAIMDRLPHACQKMVSEMEEAIRCRMPMTESIKVDVKHAVLFCARQYVHVCKSHAAKRALFISLWPALPNGTVVFCNTRQMVHELVDALHDKSYNNMLVLHGLLSQVERISVVRHFSQKLAQNADRSSSVAGDRSMGTILIATDLMARGIETEPVPFVVNYDVPSYREYYLPRVGRVAPTGVAFSLAVNDEVRTIRTIEQLFDTTIGAKQFCANVIRSVARKHMDELDEHI